MKKYLTKLIFLLAIVICFSITAIAQKTENDKKGVRKPPKIVVPDKRESPKNDKSKDKNKDKSAKLYIYIQEKASVNV